MKRIKVLIITGLIFGLYAQDIANKPKEGYLIKTVWEEYDPKEINFLSPDGKIMKVLPVWKVEYTKGKEKDMEVRNFSEVLVSENRRYALQVKESKLVSERLRETVINRDITLRLSYFNAEGSVLWRKKFSVWFISPDEEGYGYKVSHSGKGILFFRSKRVGNNEFRTEVYVFETRGRKVAKVTHNSLMRKFQISPDGGIVGARVSDGYLFFLNVKTGRTKLVNAEGDGWGGFFILSSSHFPSESGKILIGWRPLGGEYSKISGGGIKMKDVTFNSLPDALSEFFGKWK
ncbi:MAG: hypothetical protein E3J87_04365 [Candidatus Cloacimonadota bacterium]|nr:MAG: hypothetical protein E3J87_04365 [Candidatus Cloacimonadota bacterium]